MGKLYYIVALTPGLLQIILFLVLLGLFAWVKKWRGTRLAAALIGTGLFLGLIGGTAPYWLFTHLLIAGLGAATWKRSTRSQVLAVVSALVIFTVCYVETSEVLVTFPSTAIWKIGERGAPGSGNPPEQLVELKFGVNHDVREGRFSDSLADYLARRNIESVPVEIPMYYNWGVGRAMGVLRVDGKDFPASGGGYASWSSSQPNSPVPKYYFGLKSFVSKK